ncbi:MAG: CHC2 zinc finger domain-containing protein [Acidobacteriota bacterium]|nr:CHC2 zinc finger domain-containing protein [Acidobacteriota bacterium]
MDSPSLHLAERYHKALPQRLRDYLKDRGLDDDVIDRNLIGWDGRRITIPIFNREGRLAFFKLAKDPHDLTPGPKIMASYGAYLELYGWDVLLRRPPQIIICEGEFDRLVLEAQGFDAVTSTGGASGFKPEWGEEFASVQQLYLCYDRDDAGRRGALQAARFIQHAKLVELPIDVGKGGDVTDFFVRLGWKREAFLRLLEQATPPPVLPPPVEPAYQPRNSNTDGLLGARIERIKQSLPIEKVISEYTPLRLSGQKLVGLCPLHDDHNPSLTVYPATGTFRCYGCGKHGDVINFIQEAEQMSFSQALDTLERAHP